MALMRWDPFGEMMRMQRDMEGIYGRMGMRERGASNVAWMPKIDVEQKGDDLVVHAELPGVKREDIDVEVTDGVLTIKGERKAEEKREGEGWLVRESSFGSFERSMALPEGIDPASIKADIKDGVLLVTVPKAMEAAKPKTTKVELGAGVSPGQKTEGQGSMSAPQQGMQMKPEEQRVPVGAASGQGQMGQ